MTHTCYITHAYKKYTQHNTALRFTHSIYTHMTMCACRWRRKKKKKKRKKKPSEPAAEGEEEPAAATGEEGEEVAPKKKKPKKPKVSHGLQLQ